MNERIVSFDLHMMHITTKKLPQSKVEITVVLPWEEWKKEEAHAVEHMSANVHLPGFRKGKVPQAVLEGKYGRQSILVETAEHAVEHTYPKALVEAKAEALGRPEIRLDVVKEHEPLTFVITTAVLPEVTLKDWKKEVKQVNKIHAGKESVVTDAEVEAEVKRLAEMRATLVTVNREARPGDSVEIDFTVSQNGVPIEGGMGKKHPLVLGSKSFIPGFEDALVGMKAGEEKTISLEFPQEYHARQLAGKPAQFAVKLLLVQERTLPVVDDAFVKGLGRFESVEALKKSIHDGILEERKQELSTAHRTTLLDALFLQAELEYPEVLVAQEQDHMLRQFRSQVETMGFAWEQYLRQMKKTEVALRAEWEAQAKKRIAAELILQKLARELELAVDSTEIEAEMNKTLQYYRSVKNTEKELDLERLYTAVQDRLLNEKVLSWLEKM